MQVMSGPNTSQSDCMYDICDGSIFRNHAIYMDCNNALQIIMYYDEFTAVNAISPVSGKNKMGQCMCHSACRCTPVLYN
jgi:hypothetical protein